LIARLQLSFLGAYRASQTGAGELTFTNRKVMGLLAFLALEARQAHSRETLMGLLWPEMSEADARNNLRVTLARLRGFSPRRRTAPSKRFTQPSWMRRSAPS
ncbi:winged helix-turn-helix domain-containing protein, partial [Arthrospira platensis SPKY1]|nr:winged helix-turn-helix domain-containing protein [Arthrospira platensis SPKY1]